MNNEMYINSENTSTDALRILMRNVYTWMTCGLMMTALSALIVVTSPVLSELLGKSWIFLCIAEIGIAWYMGAKIRSMSFNAAGLLFAVFAIINGALLSSIFLVYTMNSIFETFIITAGMFLGMTLIGYTTKKNLTGIGQVLYMALIGLIIASLFNFFMHNSMMMAIINYAGVAIFIGLTAYDTQAIKNMLLTTEADGDTDSLEKLAMYGSLTLYLDFINMFLHLLRLMGEKK